MIYLNQASWDEFHRLLNEQKQRFEIWGRISERQEAGGQIYAPATIKIRPQNIVETAKEEPRPSAFSVETESVVGLEEKFQVFEPEINLENDSSEECSNDEQDRYTASNHKITSIDMVIEDIDLAAKTTPIDIIIGDKADMEKFRSATLFELKAEIGEIIMSGGHNNCSTHSAADKKSLQAEHIWR
ncbi:hypothetical protein ACFXTI_046187 [Malus domestica]